MTGSPLGSVAVVIPCHNDGGTLAEAVRSAKAQTRLDRLIVIDDGSTDTATQQILAELNSNGVTVLHQSNLGPGQARLHGLQASKTDYVLTLDADDRLLPGSLSALAEALDQNRKLAVVWGDYKLFGEHDYLQRTAGALDPWQITYLNDLPSTAMFRCEAVLRYWHPQVGGLYEDWDLWMSLAEHSQPGMRVNTVVYQYRRHGWRRSNDLSAMHAAGHDSLRDRHKLLFAARRSMWRQSSAPWLLRLSLPVVFTLPIGSNGRRLLGGVVCHLANRRSLRLLMLRILGHRRLFIRPQTLTNSPDSRSR